MHDGLINLGLTAQEITTYLQAAGYWSSPEKCSRHAFVLSPCAYVLREEGELQDAARALYAAVANLEIRLSTLARKKQLSHTEAAFLRLGRVAAHGLFRPGEAEDTAIPPVLKIDMVRGRSRWYAVEVDTYNPRALGTIALMDGLLSRAGKQPAFSIVSALCKILSAAGTRWGLVVSEKERYYQTSYEVLASFLRQRGVEVTLFREQDMAGTCAPYVRTELPFVFFIPEDLDRHPVVRDRLMEELRGGNISTCFPPKAYLGSKAFLPFIAMQPGAADFIPPTALLSDDVDRCVFSRPLSGNNVVLKQVISSGSKGVVWLQDNHLFDEKVRESKRSKTPLWVVQEEVDQVPIIVPVFNDEHRIETPYHLRLTMYATAQGIAGLKMTGRQDRLVHGAPDCIQLPVVQL